MSKAKLWDWIKAICTLMSVVVILYKIYLTPIDLEVDFSSLLSILLAFFSVGLASLFYFKATESSNKFYDNTYKFTKDIAQLLIKIESGFGEKLRSLDEGYSSMRDYLQNPSSIDQDIYETEEKIRFEKEQMERVKEETSEMISDLLNKSQLKEQERIEIRDKLNEKENDLVSSQEELIKMNEKLLISQLQKEREQPQSGFDRYSLNKVIYSIGIDVFLATDYDKLKIVIDEELEQASERYILNLQNRGYYSNGITQEGLNYLIRLAKENVL